MAGLWHLGFAEPSKALKALAVHCPPLGPKGNICFSWSWLQTLWRTALVLVCLCFHCHHHITALHSSSLHCCHCCRHCHCYDIFALVLAASSPFISPAIHWSCSPLHWSCGAWLQLFRNHCLACQQHGDGFWQQPRSGGGSCCQLQLRLG